MAEPDLARILVWLGVTRADQVFVLELTASCGALAYAAVRRHRRVLIDEVAAQALLGAGARFDVRHPERRPRSSSMAPTGRDGRRRRGARPR